MRLVGIATTTRRPSTRARVASGGCARLASDGTRLNADRGKCAGPEPASLVPSAGMCGPRGGMHDFSAATSMPPIAEILCQRCGARTEAVMLRGRASVAACPCGGMLQVIRVARHRDGEPSASPERIERSVRHRSDEETTSIRPRHEP